MATIESFKKASHNLIEWDKNHPQATAIEGAKAAGRFFKEFSEVDIRWATLLSILAPMPESSVKNLERKLKNRKH